MPLPGIYLDVNSELKKVRKSKRDLANREKALKAERALEKDIEKWQRIMDAKAACNKIIKEYNIGNRMTLTRLDNFPDYYIYQHPVHKKLKTSDRNVAWVRQYLAEIPMGSAEGSLTGVEEDLTGTARKSRLAAWKRINKKTKKSAKVTKGSGKGKGGSGKAQAVGSVGVG